MRERGQILVLFAISVTVLLIVAALAFDTGMMLVERRDQQNAADAAALAGARYLITNPTRAESDAYAMAARNGFADSDSVNVDVHIPPAHGLFRGLPGFIEVQIEASRSSIFGSVVGRTAWGIGAYAVAANQHGLRFGFGMLALNETACKAIHVSGSGHIYSAASIQSNSSGADCPDPPYGFSRSGTSEIEIDVDAIDAVCRTVGAIQDAGSGSMTCAKDDYSFALPDPLRGLTAPSTPALADAILPILHSGEIPNYCPGAANASKQPSESSPKTCVIGLGSDAGKSWLLSPGLYPGGLDIKGGSTIYLLPGIYWIGGGGFTVSGDSSILSVASSLDLTPGGGGVLLYNSKLPGADGGPITLNGGGASVNLQPLAASSGSPEAVYNDIVIFQDRAVTTTVTLNGSASVAEVRGIVYVPEGDVKLNGNGGTLTVDQVIADEFLIDGDRGTVNVLRERGVDVVISGVGLVE